ncbi:MAG TPA: RNA-binding protein [Flavisolibacter sp.]|nr:RNA-binding protein [Flavisolibacter sp.]
MTIYASNLGFSVVEQDLRELFQQFGTINSIKIIADHTTGMSKGFAFIEMPIEKEATTAIAELNNRDYNNRKISVQEARPKGQNSTWK